MTNETALRTVIRAEVRRALHEDRVSSLIGSWEKRQDKKERGELDRAKSEKATSKRVDDLMFRLHRIVNGSDSGDSDGKIADIKSELGSALGDSFDGDAFDEMISDGPSDELDDYISKMRDGTARGKRSKTWIGRVVFGW